ncbi:unnamed protein product [Boreogadus saida]
MSEVGTVLKYEAGGTSQAELLSITAVLRSEPAGRMEGETAKEIADTTQPVTHCQGTPRYSESNTMLGLLSLPHPAAALRSTRLSPPSRRHRHSDKGVNKCCLTHTEPQ